MQVPDNANPAAKIDPAQPQAPTPEPQPAPQAPAQTDAQNMEKRLRARGDDAPTTSVKPPDGKKLAAEIGANRDGNKVKEKAQQNEAEAGKVVKEGTKDNTGTGVALFGTAAMTVGAFLPWPANAIVCGVGLISMVVGKVMQSNADKKAAVVSNEVDKKGMQDSANAKIAEAKGERPNILAENLQSEPSSTSGSATLDAADSGKQTS